MTLARRIFRVLLIAFPIDVRREHGHEMEEAFAHMLEARGRSGQEARWSFLLVAYQDVVREGLAERARRLRGARKGASDPTGVRELVRTGGGGMMITDLLDDLRLALRGLVRAPGAGAVLVSTLALGIGANTAVFSVLQGVLLRPLPYSEPHELVSVRHHLTQVPEVGLLGIPGPDLLDYVEGAPSLEAMGSVATLETNLNDDQGAARVTIGWVTPGFFDVLAPGTAVGRLLDPSDWTPRTRAQMEDPTFQPPPMPVLLAHGLWRDRFGSDPGLVGRNVTLNGTHMNVVGVLEEGFRVHAPADAQIPGSIDAFSYLPIPMTEGQRGRGGGITLARLADGASLEQARTELEGVAQELVATWEQHARFGTEVVVEPLMDGVVSEARPFLWVLFGAIGIVLLIAVLNVANLQLVRAGARRQEFAVRLALGVGRGRLIRQLLAESALFAALGAAVGLLLATWGVRSLVALAPADIPRLDTIGMNLPVLLFTLGIAGAAAIAFGLAPAVATTRVDASSLLASRGALDGGAPRLRAALIIGEIALSVVLLAGAGLLMRSFSALQAVDPGYEPEGAVAVEIALPFFTYRQLERRQAFFDELLERAGAIPGVTSAGLTPTLPLAGPGGTWSATYGEPGADLAVETAARARYRAASPGLFEAMGARIVDGRGFRTGDGSVGSELVVMVDRRLADATWPGQSAVGRYMEVQIVAYIGQGRTATARVVGVVEPIRYEVLSEPGDPLIWVPFNEYSSLEASLVLRGPGDPLAAASAVRAILRDLDPGAPVYGVRRLEEDHRAATSRSRYALLLVGIFALSAMLLAAVGLFGVVSTSVQRRTREFGLRIALGAPARDVGRMILMQGARLATVGVILGMGAAVAAGPLIRSMLFEVEPTDAPTLLATSLTLIAVAAAAAWVPAARASRMDPVDALRYE